MKYQSDEMIFLPKPEYDGKLSFEKILKGRRSIRNFSSKALTQDEISQLLWAADGITAHGGLRTAPSAGALYPLELYIAVGNVNSFSTGVYKYNAHKHSLIKTDEGDKRAELSQAALGQSYIEDSSAVIIIAAEYKRITGKYGQRGIQYTYIETGNIAQNISLQNVSLNIGTVIVGAFDDSEVKRVLNIREYPLCLMPIGR